MKRNILGTVILIALGQQPMFEQLIADLPPTPRLPAAHAFNRVVLLGEKDQMSATLDIIVANGRVSVENAHISSAMSVDGIQMSDTLNKGGNVMFMGSAEDLRDAMFMPRLAR